MDKEKEYLYWLSHIPGFGAVTIRKLWEFFNSFEAIYNIEGKQLQEQGFLSPTKVDLFDLHKENLCKWKEEYHTLAERGIQFITPMDKSYPERLRMIYDYPMGLYVRGNLPDANRGCAAIIGARNCSNYGVQMAERFAEALSREGIQVISGLALGIDGAGHKGALKAGGDTYGILGCGINICYPREHYGLYKSMLERGGIISEYGLGEKPNPRNFPMRNRIISGLSDVIIVAEARERSGSLITVELALDQGKEVFALPGRVTDALSTGCNQLIQQGANILVSPYDILEYFGVKSEKLLRVHENNEKGLAKTEKMVYSCLDLQPKFLEEVVQMSGLTLGDCMSALLQLELKGYVVQTSSQYYGKSFK